VFFAFTFTLMEEQRHSLLMTLLAYTVQRGVAPEAITQAAHVDLSAMQNGTATITSRQYDDLWFHAAQLCQDPLFGLHFGESIQLTALGIVGQIIQTSRTVGEALTTVAPLTVLVTDQYTVEIKRTRAAFTASLKPAAPVKELSPTTRHLRDFLVVFMIHELDGLLLKKVQPLTATFPEAVAPASEYTRVLRCAPTRKAGPCTITFDAHYWDEPIITANHALQQILLQRVAGITTVLPTVAPRFKDRVLTCLEGHSYLGILTLEDVAANFNMSPRSLQRRLQEEHVSFQQLADDVRKSLAVRYLSTRSHPVKEVSAILGYNELSAFSRAFKRWTGKTPVEYQA
jgi:AraC-like DNA-binding protein